MEYDAYHEKVQDNAASQEPVTLDYDRRCEVEVLELNSKVGAKAYMAAALA